jgi:MFS superfamily sulfate permease-like transporter
LERRVSRLTRLLNENRVAGTLGAAGLLVIWFGWPVLLGAAKLVREALTRP